MYVVELRFGINGSVVGPSPEVIEASVQQHGACDVGRIEHLRAKRVNDYVHVVCFTLANDLHGAETWGRRVGRAVAVDLPSASFRGLRIWPEKTFGDPT
jgi:hypothetical protein